MTNNYLKVFAVRVNTSYTLDLEGRVTPATPLVQSVFPFASDRPISSESAGRLAANCAASMKARGLHPRICIWRAVPNFNVPEIGESSE